MTSTYRQSLLKGAISIIFSVLISVLFAQKSSKLILKTDSNGKFGYVDEKGVKIIDFIYDRAFDFDETGCAEVFKGDNMGIINTGGVELQPFNYYKIATSGSSEDIKDSNGNSVLPQSLKGMNIEIEGFELFSPVSLYFNRAIIVVNGTEEGLYDCDLKKFIIPLSTQKINGLGFGQEIGLPNKKNKPQSNEYSELPNSFLMIIERENPSKNEAGGYSLVNFSNKVLVPFGKYDYIADGQLDGLIEVEKKEKCGFIDCNGLEVIKCEYESTETPKSGMIAVQDFRTHLKGLVNYEGRKILDCQFNDIKHNDEYFVNGLIAVKNRDNKWGFVNLSGVPVITYKFTDVTPFLGNYAAVETDSGNWSLIDKNGDNIILKYLFGGARIESGFVDEDGNVIARDLVKGQSVFQQKDKDGKLHNWSEATAPYLVNYLNCKRCNYLELLTFDVENQNKIRLLVSESGKFEYRTSPIYQ